MQCVVILLFNAFFQLADFRYLDSKIVVVGLLEGRNTSILII